MTKKISLIILVFFSGIIRIACSSGSPTEQAADDPIKDIQISPYGSRQSFDIITWNIQNFPKDYKKTIPYLVQIIRDIDVDFIAVQEIENAAAFEVLIDSLDGWAGIVSKLPDFGQRLGLLFKADMISVSEPYQIYTDDDWAFPRPPLVTYVTVYKNSQTVFDFTLIVNHLKAYTDGESESRRRTACSKLKSFIDDSVFNQSDKDVILLGDFNDEVDDPPVNNIFFEFIGDSLNYTILTLPLADTPTYIGAYLSAIDHLIIGADTREEYQGGLTQILKIDQEFTAYGIYISDHRPVLSQFFVF
jgi:hypothetical protein